MELLRCDDFEPFTPQTGLCTSETKQSSNDTDKNFIPKKQAWSENVIKLVEKRSSVIDPPSQFEDKLSALNDNFELIETFLNDNFNSFNNNNENSSHYNGRKYSDDMSSIDPKLINECDDLTIPDHLRVVDNSPDPYSLQYDRSVSAFEPVALKARSFASDLKRSVSLMKPVKPKSAMPKVNGFREERKATAKHKSTASINSSAGKKKASGPAMKRSLSVAEPAARKNIVEANNRLNATNVSPSSLAKTSNPFTVDDDMFEEYRKYEEMYLQEKQQKLEAQTKKTATDAADDCIMTSVGKINSDSAYSR